MARHRGKREAGRLSHRFPRTRSIIQVTHACCRCDAVFRDALEGLRRGDFSRLEPLFESRCRVQPRIIEWYDEGRFADEPEALAEALTNACFLGQTSVADYLLTRGVDPSGGSGTGLNAIHWAANRGQLEAVRLLLRHKVPLEKRSMYEGTALGTAVWSAIARSPSPIIFRLSRVARRGRSSGRGWLSFGECFHRVGRRRAARAEIGA